MAMTKLSLLLQRGNNGVAVPGVRLFLVFLVFVWMVHPFWVVRQGDDSLMGVCHSLYSSHIIGLCLAVIVACCHIDVGRFCAPAQPTSLHSSHARIAYGCASLFSLSGVEKSAHCCPVVPHVVTIIKVVLIKLCSATDQRLITNCWRWCESCWRM